MRKLCSAIVLTALIVAWVALLFQQNAFAYTYIWLEAEAGSLATPMEEASDSNASGNKYIWVPSGVGDSGDPYSVSSGKADYDFEIDAPDTYVI